MNFTALVLNLVLAAWLFISAFVLPHSVETAWNAMLVAVAISAVAFLAYSAPGRPGLRWVNTVLAVWLFSATMILPHLTLSTMVSDVLVALAVSIVSLIPPHRWAIRGGAGPEAHGTHTAS